MVYVVLRNGKVLQYNSPNNTQVVNGVVNFTDGKNRYAEIPLDVIERIEWVRPCNVSRIKLSKGRDY